MRRCGTRACPAFLGAGLWVCGRGLWVVQGPGASGVGGPDRARASGTVGSKPYEESKILSDGAIPRQMTHIVAGAAVWGDWVVSAEASCCS